jgi:ABC-2 type transport system permease protein
VYFLIKYLIRLFQRRKANAQASESSPDSVGEPAASAVRPARARRSPSGPSAASRGPLALLAHQARYDVMTGLRNPRARFMTFIFPVILLVVFTGVFGHGHTRVDGQRVSLEVFYVPGILAMSVVVASYANLVISITNLRESGVLKRRRATPVSPALLIAGQAIATVVIALWMSAVLLVIAQLLYGVGFSLAALAAIAIAVVVGTISFSCIGYAVAGLIGSPDAAQPIVQATMLPLWFISGVFIPDVNLSSTLSTIGKVFPVEHLADTLHRASVNSSFSSAISVSDLLVLAAWAVAAGAFAAWRFSWLPSTATA